MLLVTTLGLNVALADLVHLSRRVSQLEGRIAALEVRP
jgi:hypothetical protein